MGNSKVIFGNETLIDLTGDTVTPDTLLAGTTAHNRSGNQIVGTATVPEELDDLTDVDITSAAEGDLLQYDSTSGKWVNSAKIQQKVAGLQKTGCVNILPNDATSMTKNGVTYTVNSDLSVLLNGTPTVDTWFFIGVTAKIKKGKYKLVGAPSGAGESTYYLRVGLTTQSDGSGSAVVDGYDYGDGVILDAQSDLYVRNYSGIFVWAGVPLNNVLFKPMITTDLSATYADYAPYSMTNRELTEAVTEAAKTAIGSSFDISAYTYASQYVAPCDGWLTVGAKGDTSKAIARIMGSNGSFGPEVSVRGNTQNDWLINSVYVRKGMKLYNDTANTTGTVQLRFYPIS